MGVFGGATLRFMPTVVLEDTFEMKALKERRRRSGIDRLDEVWEGVLHMVLAPSGRNARVATQLALLLGPAARAAGLTPALGALNLGDSEWDFRVPDATLFRKLSSDSLWNPTAALVVEIVSPGDETWQKLPFYAAHNVDEILIVDPEQHSVYWLGLLDGEYQDIECSALIELGKDELAERIDWP
jgi:Uma2 family endonuclease